MPLLDLPLEQLKTYQGRNPRPDDFDAFWQQSLDELAAVPAEPELRPADFTSPLATCHNLYFTSTHGARIHAKLLQPKRGEGRTPILLHFHGYTGNSGDWINLLHYAASGFTVAAMDCRGQGGLSEDISPTRGGTLYGHVVKGVSDTPDKLYYRNVFLDTRRLAEVVCDLEGVNPDRVASFGGSQGGGLALACAALSPDIVSRTVAQHPFLCDYQRVWEMDLAKGAYIGLCDYFRRFDPRHEQEAETFRRLGYVDVQHLASRIKANVLMATGLMDDICPPSTQYAAYNKLQTQKEMVLYPDFRHELLPGFYDRAYGFLCQGWVPGA
ncbi:MAG: cah [Puniceicoccaceae bacterium 5H]|nr:MAG: cah [Puniceicoccaceae bacterium 5H]